MIEGNGCQDNAVCGCGRSCVVLRAKACLENGASNVILREKLKAVPNRLAPKVTVVTDQKENFIILTEEMEGVIREIQAAIAEIINT